MKRSPASGILRCAVVVLAALALACGDDHVTAPAAPPSLAKSSGSGPTVVSTDPSYGDQGTIALDVRIFGSGFDAGSRASWERNGVPYAKVTVNRTILVSSSELVANITIAADAALDFYDVAVYTSGGRKGIGTELFEITAAVVIPSTTHALGINDAGQVVGIADTTAFHWDPATGVTTLLESGFAAWDVDQLGTTIAGQRNNLVVNGSTIRPPVMWVRAGSGTWGPPVELPSFGAGGVARSMISDASGAAAIIVGQVSRRVDKRSGVTLPAKWTRDPAASSGWRLDTLATAGFANAYAWGVNAAGLAAGSLIGSRGYTPVVWEADGRAVVLAPLTAGASSEAKDISRDGTIAVGQSGDRPVMWIRSAGGNWNPTPVDLDAALGITAACSGSGSSRALEINAAGVIVGQDCGIPYMWRLSGNAVGSRTRLGGLGSKTNDLAWATAINDASPATAAGKATTSGTANFGVIWNIPAAP